VNDLPSRIDPIHETVLDVDAPGIETGEIAYKLLKPRWRLERISLEESKQSLRLWLKIGGP
jgi:hypothetical protein